MRWTLKLELTTDDKAARAQSIASQVAAGYKNRETAKR
jgi:hypothetical protein